MGTEYYHHCRRCRAKLAAPVGNPLSAYCCRGCFNAAFRKACIVCGKAKSGTGLACKMPQCMSVWRAKKRMQTRGKYVDGPDTPPVVDRVQKTPDFIESARPDFRLVAGPELSPVELKAIERYWPEPRREAATPEELASAKQMRRSEYQRHSRGGD